MNWLLLKRDLFFLCGGGVSTDFYWYPLPLLQSLPFTKHCGSSRMCSGEAYVIPWVTAAGSHFQDSSDDNPQQLEEPVVGRPHWTPGTGK